MRLKQLWFLIVLGGDTDTRCRNCRQSGITCVREARIRFRHATAASEDWGKLFPERKSWPCPASSRKLEQRSEAKTEQESTNKGIDLVRFRDETTAVAREYESDSSSFPPALSPSLSIPETDANNDSGPIEQHGVDLDPTSQRITPLHRPLHYTSQLSNSKVPTHLLKYIERASRDFQLILAVDYSSFGNPTGHSASPMVVHSSQDMTSPRVGDLFSTSRSLIFSLSDREAVLLRNFTEKMALWVGN